MMYLHNLSEIFTKQGILRVDRLKENLPVLSYEGDITFIKKVEPFENVEIYNLELKNGTTVSVGKDTIVETSEGPKKIQDVKVEDFIGLSFGILKNNKGGQLINFEEDLTVYNRKPIKSPKKMTEDLALWLGIIASKGRYSDTHRYTAVSLDDEVARKIFFDLTLKIFKDEPKYYPDNRTDKKTYYIQGVNLARFLKHILGQNSNLKKVPQQIIEGSLNEQLSFIKGLSLDGYTEQGQLTVYGGISKRIADFVAMVLRNCGHAVYQQVRKSGQGNNIFYTKITGSSKNSIKFEALEPEKNKNLNEGGFFVAVTKEILEARIPVTHPKYSSIRNIRQRGSKVCYHYTLDALGIDYPLDKHFVMVKDISKSVRDGYGIETEDGSGLVFDGLILKSHL